MLTEKPTVLVWDRQYGKPTSPEAAFALCSRHFQYRPCDKASIHRDLQQSFDAQLHSGISGCILPSENNGKSTRDLHIPITPPTITSIDFQQTAKQQNFILRVYVWHQFLTNLATNNTLHTLITFHSTHKYLLMAHSPTAYKTIGQLLGNPHQYPFPTLCEHYIHALLMALTATAQPGHHANALTHMLGYLKKQLPNDVKQEILFAISAYQRGHKPLIEPIQRLHTAIQQSDNAYIKSQRYLSYYLMYLK